MIIMANTFIVLAMIILESQFHMRSKLTNILIKTRHILKYETKRFEVNILLHPLEKMKNGRSSIHVNITFQHFQGVLLLYQVKR